MRSRFLVVAAVLSVVSACSDAPAPLDPSNSAARLIAAPNGALDVAIYDLVSLYPTGTETAALNRWNNVKKAYAAGSVAVAKSDLLLLSQWLIDKSSTMSDPPGAETRQAAAARLILYMATYVFNGPSSAIPSSGGGADNAVGLITPAGGLVVTPSTNAGVSVPAGAVDENTLVVITENLTPYPANCSGPLNTRLCQYPKFYHFSQFPDKHLNSPATFAVCHVNTGTSRYPLADHDRFRLAHNKPANAADYTPGGTVVDDIEILPLATQTFSFCDDIEYALTQPTGLDLVLATATSAISKFLTPKSAYAIDQGLGGFSLEFSDFNDVDPDGRPDYTANAGGFNAIITPSGDLSVSYFVKNIGTATSPAGVLASFTLTPVVASGPAPSVALIDALSTPWTSVGVMSLVPGDSVAMTTTASVASFASGSYTLELTLGSDPSFPDSNLSNNSRATTVTLGPIILKKGKRLP